MTTTKGTKSVIIREIDGYIREMADKMHPKVIPNGINQIIYTFYDPVCIKNIHAFLHYFSYLHTRWHLNSGLITAVNQAL